MGYNCKYCNKTFARESSLAAHICEQKKRFQNQNDPGVKIGYQAYLRFFQMTQGSARLKTYEDFATSSYYRAFVKFGHYCRNVRVINVSQYTDWLINNNKKLDHWARDILYSKWLEEYVRTEATNDALQRAIEESIDWNEKTGNPTDDYLRYGNVNSLCYAITTGRVTGWVLYNCASGQEFLSKLNEEQIVMLWPWINTDIWTARFAKYPSDVEYAKHILAQLGW